MRILEFIHDEDHPEFSNIDIWVKENEGFSTRKLHAYKEFKKPEPDSFDLILLHGGTQHVWNKAAYPWLCEEAEFVKEAMLNGKPVAGFCLGSQIIADILGGKVYEADKRELGWYKVIPKQGGREHCLMKGLETGFTTFLWHSDHYVLPEYCNSLAYTEAAPHQVFSSYALPAVGFQFHPEYTKDIIMYYFYMCPEEFRKEGRYAENTESFLEEFYRMPDTYPLFRKLMNNTIEYFKNEFELFD